MSDVPARGRADHGQGRSLLRRGAVAQGPLPDGWSRVGERSVDLAGAARDAARLLRRCASLAECDDEVHAEAIRSWLSGRGLPSAPGAARAYLRRRVVQRVLSDLVGGRRGKLAAHRRDLRALVAEIELVNSEGATTRVNAADTTPARWGSPEQMEAALDAHRAALCVASTPGRCYGAVSAADRTAAVLATLDGSADTEDVAADLGVTGAAVRLWRKRAVEHARSALAN